MLAYFIRRLLLVIPTFIGITVLVFTITRFVPGGPMERAIAEMQQMSLSQGSSMSSNSLSEEQLADLSAFYGMDKPVWQAYLDWMGKLLQGDLGESTFYQDPVLDLILDRLPVSTFYGVCLFLISYGVSIPLGIAKARHHGSWFDNLSSIAIFVGFALPGFVVGILLLTVFSFQLEWFPFGGFVSDEFEDLETLGEQVYEILWHAVLPLLAYAIGDFAILTMTMKNSLMENLSADYVRTAIAKGLPFDKALKQHALRNSLIPIASHFGAVVSVFFAGSFLIEAVFNIDGIGLLGYDAILQRDYPVVMGILVMTSIAMMIGNILSDICVAIVDPRVKFGK
ncbi:ABC transporter permease subunit [Motilimonas sp. 1_MG-2023]|uniref:ABC transporter permease subunit n=1 Tax=Motilimonas TaxID=1914248 RepID=UPI0026E1E653|nr:ABC transporter permease subunit [Motilimonas sp. 1_MG-2023]MDO6527185.1 ABC transporter permease subunit [Motilimonas sp. 1_MG-2023]